jgi:hypothetical protein
MEPKNTKTNARKRSAPAFDKKIRFQPKPEKSNSGNGSLILSTKV